MTEEKLNEIAKQVFELDRQFNDKNAIEIINKMETLIKDCSIVDLDRIDELIQKKYLTN